MTDHLARLNVQAVHAWYRRLAASVGARHVMDGSVARVPLAAQLLNRYLDARPNDVFEFDAPSYLKNASQVQEGLRYHRAVFLSQREARIGRGTRLVGVLPRLRGTSGFQRWTPGTQLRMTYHSLVSIGESLTEILRIQSSGTPQERDLFTALRGFQLHSEVTLDGQASGAAVAITFNSWQSHVSDRYDFDYDEHLTLPNPDHGSTRPDAVRPGDRQIRVYHRNAQRMVQAGLAAPFDLRSRRWVPPAALMAAATVTP